MVVQKFRKTVELKKITFLLLLLNSFIFTQTVDSLSGFGKLIVVIKGFESDEGDCRFALDK